MPLFSPLVAALLLAAAPPAHPALSKSCADDPGLFQLRPLPRREIDAMLRFYRNEEIEIVQVGASSFEMSGPCVRTLRFVASGIVLDNGRTMSFSEPPLALTRSDYVSPAFFTPTPIDPALRRIDGANVGSKHKLRYITSWPLTRDKRLGLWSNDEVSAVETISCVNDASCIDPVPLLSSTRKIREIFVMPDPDSGPVEVLRLWIGDDCGKAESIQLAALDPHSPLLGWNGRKEPPPACELYPDGPCS